MTPKYRSLAILLPYTSGTFIQSFQYLHLYVELASYNENTKIQTFTFYPNLVFLLSLL